MESLEVLVYPDPMLREKAKPVESVTDDLRELAARMLVTMFRAPGVGLAANQVGDLRRIVAVDGGLEGRSEDGLILVNPEIVAAEGEAIGEEGCLSFPDATGMVGRARKIRYKATDLDGNPIDNEAEGLLARVIQHEVDHLNGVLFVDHIRRLKRDLIKRRFEREHRRKARQSG